MSTGFPSIITTHPEHRQNLSPSPTATFHTPSPSTHAFLSPSSPYSPGSPPHTRASLEPPSPYSPGSPPHTRASLEPPSSPSPSSASSNEPSSSPPSPTLSHKSSVQFATSLALRDTKPSTPALLSPTDTIPIGVYHRRRSSASSIGGTSSDGSDSPPDLSMATLRHVKTSSSDNTRVARSRSNSRGKSRSRDSNRTSIDLKGKSRETNDHLLDDLPQDIDSDPSPFAFKPYLLAQMLDPKNFKLLELLGGVQSLLSGLGTTPTRGVGNPSPTLAATPNPPTPPTEIADTTLPGIVITAPEGNKQEPDDCESLDTTGPAFSAPLEERRRVYGPNILPHRATKSLISLMLATLKDKVLILLSLAAIVSFALGLLQDFGPGRTPGQPPVDWVEGVAIMVAILIVVIVGSLSDWQKEKQFQDLNEKKDERGVKVIRDGVERIIDIKDVVVGDIALLEPGEVVPCDGVFLTGHNVKCDESGATGESDAIKKVSYDECRAIRQKMYGSHPGKDNAIRAGEIYDLGSHPDCFVLSGSKVLEGVGTYVVVAVGTKSFNGRIMMALREDTEHTPLQLKLNALAELIAKLGVAAGLILLMALMIRFFVELGTRDPPRTANQKGIAFVNILIISVTLVVVAVPEGLPLAVTLALAFATKRMTHEKLLVRVLGSCETMANASVVCTDKTGTLTQNEMTVVAGSIGIHAKFVHKLKDNSTRANVEPETEPDLPKSQGTRKHLDDFSLDETELNNVLSPHLQNLLNAAIAINSTAFRDNDPITGNPVFVGSKTEGALLHFAERLGWTDVKKMRDEAEVMQLFPFSSERKAMGIVVKLHCGGCRLYLKGASEILSKNCSRHVIVCKEGGSSALGDDIETSEINELDNDNISRTIIFYANQSLRTIALCYRDFRSWPPKGMDYPADEVPYEELAFDLTLIGIVGIEDPLRPGVHEAVAKCHKAGVTIKMCTGDNVLTARSIASQAGIYSAGGIIMEGPVFRNLGDQEMLDVVPRLQVLARSSPEDKKLLVEKLREMGEVVGVTGDGTNDGPALKTAHVGFSMGLAGTEVAKEASDIILMDDNFASIVKAIMWGRCVNDAVRKFLQFQVCTNVTAVVITFVSAVSASDEAPVLSAVQLLWINIIMDTFAALALATDPASEALLDRKPDKKTAPLFSVDMCKQIMFQSIYQITVVLAFHFLGNKIFGSPGKVAVQTVVFNIFVFAQIFNSFNCRRLDRKLNIFEGITRNYNFIIITVIEIAIQILIVFVGGAAFQVTPVGVHAWIISVALGLVAIPLGLVVRLLPNGPFEKLFKKLRLLSEPKVLPSSRPDLEWNSAITQVRDNLWVFAQIRGGRLKSSPRVNKSRLARPSYEGDRLRLPSLMAMVPSLVASSIGAGWAPQSESLSDPAHFDPSKSSAALWEGRVQIHPDTTPGDPVYRRWGAPPSRAPSRSPSPPLPSDPPESS